MHQRRLLLILFLLLLPLASCRDEEAAVATEAAAAETPPPTPPVTREPGELPPEITWGVARNATYPLPEGTITLVDGAWSGTLGSLGEVTVELGDYHAFGDLTGDAFEEAALFLVTRPAGGPPRIDLAVIGLRNGRPAVLSTLLLGEAVQPWDLAIVDGQLQLLQLDAAGGVAAHTFVLRDRILTASGSMPLPATEAAAPRSLALFRLAFNRELPVVAVEDAFGPQGVARLLLRGSAGQRVQLTLTTPRGDGILGIVGRDGTVLQPVEAGLATWSGTLPTTQDYLLQLVATSTGAGYSLEIARGAGAPAGPPPTPAPQRTTPLAAGFPILADRLTSSGAGQPLVYLTVDNLPPDQAPTLITQLQRQGARASFFLPPPALAEVGGALAEAGHSAGPLLSGFFGGAATGRSALLANLPAASPTPCLRTPSGTMDPLTWAAVTERGYVHVGWDLDVGDTLAPGSTLAPGAIVRVDAATDPAGTPARLEALVSTLVGLGFRVEALCQ